LGLLQLLFHFVKLGDVGRREQHAFFAGHLVCYHVAALAGEKVTRTGFPLFIGIGALDEEISRSNFGLVRFFSQSKIGFAWIFGQPKFGLARRSKGFSVLSQDLNVALNVSQKMPMLFTQHPGDLATIHDQFSVLIDDTKQYISLLAGR